MIIVKLIGGLGNQMFQYAAGRRLAHHLNTVLKLDLSFLKSEQNSTTSRRYELEHLNITAEIATHEENAEFIVRSTTPLHSILQYSRQALGLPLPVKRVIAEQHFHFDPAVLAAPDNTFLDGYWQSEKYFIDISEIIHREFTVTSDPDDWNRRLAEEIKGYESCAIHVRRGDYITNSIINAHHGICPLDYYYAAIGMVISQVAKPHFFVFSDDSEWVRDNLKIHRQATFVDLNGPSHGYEDLRLMSLCRHHVIANSSFSWWGAWLARNPDKIVIAPERWFSNNDIKTHDLLPERWHRISGA